jgi:hypothetical protein
MGKSDKVDRPPEPAVGMKVLLSGGSFYLHRVDADRSQKSQQTKD